jgi:nuclear pore complex protein Nup54
LFGSKTSTAPTSGLTAFSTQAQAQTSSLACIAEAVSRPTLFGDERDAVIARWNQLEALWGTGRGYFSPHGQFVDFTPDNPFSLFKVGHHYLLVSPP